MRSNNTSVLSHGKSNHSLTIPSHNLKILPSFSSLSHAFFPPLAPFTADSTVSMYSPTASLQSSAADVTSGILKSSSLSMQGGVDSEQALRHLFAATLPLSQLRSATCEAQQALADFCPLTFLQVG